eukprot:m.122794 g.122794  ORF g.122794 m.122794 type:complete len:197 (+) comp9397_c0_seq3:94-684(+)
MSSIYISKFKYAFRGVLEIARIPLDLGKAVIEVYVKPTKVKWIWEQERPLVKIKAAGVTVWNEMRSKSDRKFDWTQIGNQTSVTSIRKAYLANAFLFTLDKENKKVVDAWAKFQKEFTKLHFVREEEENVEEKKTQLEKELDNVNYCIRTFDNHAQSAIELDILHDTRDRLQKEQKHLMNKSHSSKQYLRGHREDA